MASGLEGNAGQRSALARYQSFSDEIHSHLFRPQLSECHSGFCEADGHAAVMHVVLRFPKRRPLSALMRQEGHARTLDNPGQRQAPDREPVTAASAAVLAADIR